MHTLEAEPSSHGRLESEVMHHVGDRDTGLLTRLDVVRMQPIMVSVFSDHAYCLGRNHSAIEKQAFAGMDARMCICNADVRCCGAMAEGSNIQCHCRQV